MIFHESILRQITRHVKGLLVGLVTGCRPTATLGAAAPVPRPVGFVGVARLAGSFFPDGDADRKEIVISMVHKVYPASIHPLKVSNRDTRES